MLTHALTHPSLAPHVTAILSRRDRTWREIWIFWLDELATCFKMVALQESQSMSHHPKYSELQTYWWQLLRDQGMSGHQIARETSAPAPHHIHDP